MSKIMVRLKENFLPYLVLTGPKQSYIIKEGSELEPSGFEVELDEYEKIFKSYVDIVVPLVDVNVSPEDVAAADFTGSYKVTGPLGSQKIKRVRSKNLEV